MGIDANFKFNIPRDADFPDDITIERDPGEERVYLHPCLDVEQENLRLDALNFEYLQSIMLLGAALDHLVRLKGIKDTEGKTEKYLHEQPIAWENAKQALSKYSESQRAKTECGCSDDRARCPIYGDRVDGRE